MTQTLVWSLDLIKCGSFPSCFTPARGLGLPIRSLGHACLPSSSATSAPSYLLETCFLCHRCHSVPALLCAYHTPSQGPPASLLLSFPLCLTACPRVVESFSPRGLSPQALFFVVPGCRSLSFPSSCPSSLASLSLQQPCVSRVYQNLILGSTLQVISYPSVPRDLISLSLKATSDLHSSSSGILSFPRPKWQGYESPHLL